MRRHLRALIALAVATSAGVAVLAITAAPATALVDRDCGDFATQAAAQAFFVAAGAGDMVGLSTAWFLQEHGVEVTVLDRTGVAAGASWGNAGWLTPGLTAPLPEPGVLRYGLRTALQPSSPVFVPLRPDLKLWRFLSGFARHCTTGRWASAMEAYAPLNDLSLSAFDRMAGTAALPRAREAVPFLACFRNESTRTALIQELEHVRQSGQHVEYEPIPGAEARRQEPALSSSVAPRSACTGSGSSTHRSTWLLSPRRSWTAEARSSMVSRSSRSAVTPRTSS